MSARPRSDSGKERRKFPRCEVSLPARFTVDRKKVQYGLVLSLGPDGAFVQTSELHPVDALIRIEVSLGALQGVLRCVGSVVYHNRRAGTEIVTGLGVQFKDLPAEAQKRIEGFIVAYPGPVKLDPAGSVVWPLGRTSGPVGTAEALEAGQWEIEPERPPAEEGDPQALDPHRHDGEASAFGSSLGRYLAEVGAVPPGIEGTGPERAIRVSFRGRRLAPLGGIPERWLRRRSAEAGAEASGAASDGGGRSPGQQGEKLESNEPPTERDLAAVTARAVDLNQDPPGGSLALGLAAQMVVIHALDDATWRLEWATRSHLDALVDALSFLGRARTDIESFEEGSRSGGLGAVASESLETLSEARSGLATVERFLWRLTSNMRVALSPDEPAEDADLPELPDLAEEGPSHEKTGESGDWLAKAEEPAEERRPRARLERRVRRRAAPSPLVLKLILGIPLAIAALGAAGYGVVDYVRTRPPPSYRAYLPIARSGLAALKAGDESSLKASLASAEKALGTGEPAPASYLALKTGLAALDYRRLVSEVRANPLGLTGSLWGPGRRYRDMNTFLQAQERSAFIAKGRLEVCVDLADEILSSRAPFPRESDPLSLATMTDSAQWFRERAGELGGP